MAKGDSTGWNSFFLDERATYLPRLKRAFGQDSDIVAKFNLCDPDFFKGIVAISYENESFRKAKYPDGDSTLDMYRLLADLASSINRCLEYEDHRQTVGDIPG